MAIAIDYDKISDWINDSQQYAEGVALYIMYGDVGMLKDLFQENMNPSQTVKTKLLKSLRAILDKMEISPTLVTTPLSTPRVIAGETYTSDNNDSEKDSAFIKEKERILTLFKEQSSFQATLDEIDTEEKRQPVCLRILELDKEVSKGWDRLDYYREHRCFPSSEKPEKKMSVVDMIKRRNNLRTYLSREKNPDKISKLKAELETIEEDLNGEPV